MIWILLLGVLLAFAINALFILIRDFKRQNIYYLSYVIFSFTFLVYTYDFYEDYFGIIPNDFPNIERILHSSGIAFYYLFLLEFLRSNYDFKRFNFVLKLQLYMTIIVAPMMSFLDSTGSSLAMYFTLAFGLPSMVANFWLAYLMIINSKVYVRIMGIAYLLLLAFIFSSLIWYSSIELGTKGSNPHVLYHIATLIEIVVFNIVLTKIFFDDRLKNQININQLEKSALAAQMNPHFIFNCLNSIQGYIYQNNKTEAMEYLNQFSNLIRQGLTASRENKVTLSEEVSMLTNYLALEKMRLKDKFDFYISVEDKLDVHEIEIPPLLIQPFVENSIIHGISNLKKDGWIKVFFNQTQDDQIDISIQDNGKKTEGLGPKKPHQSYGSKITSKRLALLNKIDSKDFIVEPTFHEDFTEVKFSISLRK